MVSFRELGLGALLWLARSRAGRLFTSWLFEYMSFLLPAKRLRETDTLLAFHHPKPLYPIHILLVPRRPCQRLIDLSPADIDFMVDLFRAVRSLVAEFDLESTGYRLIANGGPYQEVPHLHFHLISGTSSPE
jgi:histidine triad (HIT) family protein